MKSLVGLRKQLLKIVAPAITSHTMQTVFVYGTLKRGQPNHYLMTTEKPGGKAVFVGEAVSTIKYPMVIAGPCHIPYVLDSPGNGHHIEGEVWDVDDVMLARLDELEGHPTYYQRDIISLNMLSEAGIEDKQDNVLSLAYFMRNYKPELEKLQTIKCFDAYGAHARFIPVKDRAPGDTLKQKACVLINSTP